MSKDYKAPAPPVAVKPVNLHRRAFMGNVAGAGTTLSLGAAIGVGVADAAEQTAVATIANASITLKVNGVAHQLSVDPRVTLLDALRDHLQLTGSKKGCDRGQCGACTVIVDGRRINACLSLAVMQDGADVTTVEGLSNEGRLSPLQSAFLERDAFQCGYCTPGQLCSATALVEELRSATLSAVTADVRQRVSVEPSDAEIRERMSGNICRCGAYPNIVAAIRDVAIGRS